ncbi:MAG TPA: hypothetical protein VGR69_08170 [Candidatus Rubrimentiphilum sp.]|nr:hypothetical protein [Candidatus Rubrimentiphilum sp.]
MLRNGFFSTAILLTLGVGTVQAAKPPAASPLVAANLRGHWTCIRTGGTAARFNEDWTPLFSGTWLRATDSEKGQATAEHTVTYNKADSTWISVDLSPLGTNDVLHGTGSGTSQIAFHAVYPPKLALAVTYARLTPTRYSIDVAGNVMGKKIKTHSVCDKR